MKKTTHSCDQCEKEIIKSALGYFEVKLVDNIIPFPALDFCNFECMLTYLNDKKDLMKYEGI